jgi:hypothetical protein
MGTSCIGVMLDTIPLYSAAAYSLGAWLALAHAPGHAAPASTVGAADVPWSVARYIGNLVLACGSAWLTAAVYVTLFGSALRGLPSKSLFGPPMFLASTLLPAVLGAIVESRTRSKLPLWVWPLPVAWQLVLAGVFHGRLIAGEPFHWWQAFACLHCGGTAVGVVLYGAAPAYGAIVYSLGALVCRRRRQADFGCPPLPAEPPKLGCM